MALGATEPEADLALTPGHFLIGRPLRAPPTRPASTAQLPHLRHWQLVQRLQQDLWNAWKSYYLQHLQSRRKWKGTNLTPINVGDIVFLKDQTLADGDCHWPKLSLPALELMEPFEWLKSNVGTPPTNGVYSLQ